MKLIDMKRPKRSTKELESQPIVEPESQEQYPYGLKLVFNEEEIDKIKRLRTIQVGQTVDIGAVGKVVEVRIVAVEKGKKKHNIEIQIQKIGIVSDDDKEQIFEAAAKD